MANNKIEGTRDLLSKGNEDFSTINWQSTFQQGLRGTDAGKSNVGKIPTPSPTGQLNGDNPTRSFYAKQDESRGFDLSVMLANVPTPVYAVAAAGLLYYIFLR